MKKGLQTVLSEEIYAPSDSEKKSFSKIKGRCVTFLMFKRLNLNLSSKYDTTKEGKVGGCF